MGVVITPFFGFKSGYHRNMSGKRCDKKLLKGSLEPGPSRTSRSRSSGGLSPNDHWLSKDRPYTLRPHRLNP